MSELNNEDFTISFDKAEANGEISPVMHRSFVAIKSILSLMPDMDNV